MSEVYIFTARSASFIVVFNIPLVDAYSGSLVARNYPVS